MKARISENKRIEIFYFGDDFCQLFEGYPVENHLQKFTDSFVRVRF
jgi:hypothetical protein